MSKELSIVFNSGRFVSGTYLKKNGEVTTFHGLAGVHKYRKGGNSSLNPSNFLIWDLRRKRYMAIVPQNILSFKGDGINVEDDIWFDQLFI